jgi:hypothetical protein
MQPHCSRPPCIGSPRGADGQRHACLACSMLALSNGWSCHPHRHAARGRGRGRGGGQRRARTTPTQTCSFCCTQVISTATLRVARSSSEPRPRRSDCRRGLRPERPAEGFASPPRHGPERDEVRYEQPALGACLRGRCSRGHGFLWGTGAARAGWAAPAAHLCSVLAAVVV